MERIDSEKIPSRDLKIGGLRRRNHRWTQIDTDQSRGTAFTSEVNRRRFVTRLYLYYNPNKGCFSEKNFHHGFHGSARISFS